MSPQKSKPKPQVVAAKVAKLEELVLYNSKLRFCPEQLQNLNYLFYKKLERKVEPACEKSMFLAKSVAERLIQRLICCAGALDSRFASKFLISCNDRQDVLAPKLEYIVRLDSISLPCLYKTDQVPQYTVIEKDPDYPAGYARIRLNSPTMKVWSEFVNAGGYLRRDRIQARMVELLSQAALGTTKSPDSPIQVDESTLCAAPGKIVDAATLHRVLHIPPEHHVFYGPSGNVPRFPDPRDFRLAIVDEPQGILVKIEFLSPALSTVSVRVRLLVGVAVDFWPSTTDFPARVPLGHADCLLYYRAAQTGCYLVGFGVQSSAWQMRVPAAEYMLLNDYGANSTVHSVLDVLFDALQEVHSLSSTRKLQLSYKILNRYNMQTALLHELEKDQEAPSNVLINWSPLYLSTIVLRILDRLLLQLKDQKQPNYFFGNANLLVNPGHLCEDDFMLEAEKIQMYLLRLFDESLMSTKGNRTFNEMMIAQNTEMLLLNKWKEIVKGLLPPNNSRQRKLSCFKRAASKTEAACAKYSRRQLEYIGMILKNMLTVKQTIQEQSEQLDEGHIIDNPLEDLIYLLVAIVEQARDQYLDQQHHHFVALPKNKTKFKSKFDAATTKLVETVRKEKDTIANLQDDAILVKTILKCLYKGLEQNKKVFGPVLTPYLNTLFQASHAVSWHLDFLKKLTQDDELEALGSFAELVSLGQITPAQGLLDAVAKNWNWAKDMLRQVQEGNLRLIFVPERGKVFRHILSLANKKREQATDGSKTLQNSRVKDGDSRRSTLPSRNYFNTILKQHGREDAQRASLPQHDVLKRSSPLSFLLQQSHRRGDHRCRGDILQALLSIQKLSVLQDVSSHLPEEERAELMETIHKLTNARGRRLLTKKWSTSLPQFTKARLQFKGDDLEIQKYTPKEESAGIPLEDGKGATTMKKASVAGTLIGSCRAARIREDSSVFMLEDNFKAKMRGNKEKGAR